MSIKFHASPTHEHPPVRDGERRCDRCGARAVAVSHHHAADLAWCEHHFREYRPLLDAVGVPISRRDRG